MKHLGSTLPLISEQPLDCAEAELLTVLASEQINHGCLQQGLRYKQHWSVNVIKVYTGNQKPTMLAQCAFSSKLGLWGPINEQDLSHK
jgi:hypothetical protein